MKKLTALLLCILLLAGCAAPNLYDGPTKSAWVLTEQVTTTYSIDAGMVWTDRWTYSYDSFGNQIHSCGYSDGDLEVEYKRDYDAQGNLTSSETWDHTGLISFPRARTGYTYDDQNRLLTVTSRNFLGIKTNVSTYVYDDEAGTVSFDGEYDTQTQWLNENGDPLRTVNHSNVGGGDTETVYEYDELGRNTKMTMYQNGSLSLTITLVYDSQDRIVEETFYDAEGVITSRSTHHYEESTITSYDLNRVKTVQTLRPDGQVETAEQFNKMGHLTKQTQYIYQEIQVPADREE